MSWLASASSYGEEKNIDKCECENMDGERKCDWCYSLDENDRQEMMTSSPCDLSSHPEYESQQDQYYSQSIQRH